jgi:hypothetical protein
VRLRHTRTLTHTWRGRERIRGKRSYARSGAPELPESSDGEVDDDEVDDKERRRLHHLCEIETRGLDGRAVC